MSNLRERPLSARMWWDRYVLASYPGGSFSFHNYSVGLRHCFLSVCQRVPAFHMVHQEPDVPHFHCYHPGYISYVDAVCRWVDPARGSVESTTSIALSDSDSTHANVTSEHVEDPRWFPCIVRSSATRDSRVSDGTSDTPAVNSRGVWYTDFVWHFLACWLWWHTWYGVGPNGDDVDWVEWMKGYCSLVGSGPREDCHGCGTKPSEDHSTCLDVNVIYQLVLDHLWSIRVHVSSWSPRLDLCLEERDDMVPRVNRGPHVLGQGTFACVYDAVHHKTDLHTRRDSQGSVVSRDSNLPVFKVYHQEFQQGMYGARLCLREMLCFEYLRHFPYMLHAYHKRAFVLCLERCSKTLGSVIRGGSWTLSQCHQWWVELVQHLQAVHRMGVYHMDLKPENLGLLENGHIRVLDWGSSWISGMKSEPVRIWTTKRYCAPEVLYEEGDSELSGAMCAAMNVWSAGCILHELLFGVPFMNAKTLDVYQLKRAWSRMTRRSVSRVRRGFERSAAHSTAEALLYSMKRCLAWCVASRISVDELAKEWCV